jgi:hypothetical protein
MFRERRHLSQRCELRTVSMAGGSRKTQNGKSAGAGLWRSSPAHSPTERRSCLHDDIRSAWRRIAIATHPDRADDGDPAAFAAAAAAYTLLRTPAGRGEALADVSEPGGSLRNGPVPRHIRLASAAAIAAWRIRHGQPRRLAIITGALTWLLATGRTDLASPH